MFIRKWSPAFAAEGVDGGVDGAEGAEGTEPAKVPLNETPTDGPGSGRSTLRKQLEKNFEQDKKRDAAEPAAKDKKPAKQRARTTANEEVETGSDEEVTTRGAVEEGGEEAAEGAESTESKIAAPQGFTEEAAAEWSKTPAPVQAAIVKRIEDMDKGVKSLKERYAEIDAALQPRLETIKQHGHTPAQAVHQLFSWFEALAGDQARIKQGQQPLAFLQLAQSFGIDPKSFGVTQEQEAGGEETEIPAPVQNYIQQLQQKVASLEQGFTEKLGQFENTFAAQTQAKTEEILGAWSKDKPYFQEVRQLMAQLIGSGVVPPLQNGSADLDKAYDMALHAQPDVRVKVLADQQKKAEAEKKAKADAEKKAQQEHALKARRTATGLGPGAPGGGELDAQNRPRKGKGKSVRESLMEAIEAAGE